MSKVQTFRDFVNQRLAAVALEIFELYERTLVAESQEVCRPKKKTAKLQIIQPVIKLHRTDVQQLSLPKPPQIKEEQELWTIQGEEQLHGLQSDTKDSIFTSPRAKPHCDPEDWPQLSPLDQTPAVENRERDSSPTNTTEEQIKAEPDDEDYGAPEPTSDPPHPSVTLNRQLAEPTCSHSLLTTRVLKSPIKSRRTQVKCSRPVPSSLSSPDTCLGTVPSPWTRPITSPHSGSESEDVSSGEAESKTVEKPYHCGECDKTFTCESELAIHRRIHTGLKHQCLECNKVFRRKDELVNHRRIHTGENPYRCEVCDRAFSRKPYLTLHRGTHSVEKPYQCQECDRTFKRNIDLAQHRKTTHKVLYPYQCQECDRTFSVHRSFIKHRRIHTRRPPVLSLPLPTCPPVLSLPLPEHCYSLPFGSTPRSR